MSITADVAHRIPAGWYPDRDDRSRRRWWDGTEWTEYFSAAPTKQLPIIEDLGTLAEVIPFPIRAAAEPAALAFGSDLDVFDSVDYDGVSVHSVRRAIRFQDRIAATILLGLGVANVVVFAFLLRLV